MLPFILFVVIKVARKGRPGRAVTDTMVLWIPVLGGLMKKTTIAKFDWNALEGQRVSFTYRKNEGENTSFASYTGATTTSLSNFWYANPRKTESYTGQINSQWSPDFRTEATVSYTTFDGSPRNAGTPYPQVQVQGISGKRLDTGATITNGAIFLGTESSRQLNAITTKETQGKFSGEYSFGAHTITAGVEDIETKYTNAFVQYTNGYYIFPNLAAWQAGTPISTYQLARPFAGASIESTPSFVATSKDSVCCPPAAGSRSKLWVRWSGGRSEASGTPTLPSRHGHS